MNNRTLAIAGLLTLTILTGLWHVTAYAANRWSAVPTPAPAVPFDYVEIDAAIAGDCKMAGDIDGDGYPDLIIGGMVAEQLNWYRYPDWHKTVIATPGSEFTTDGALGDIDGDGDLDIIVPDGDAGVNLLWFENPLPTTPASQGDAWIRHEIGAIGSWGKDVEVADFDADGRLDVATRDQATAMIFFQTTVNQWQQVTFDGLSVGEEGMASGDIDSDGAIDMVLQGVWIRNPGPAARTAIAWTEHSIGPVDPAFKALVVDLNQDGTPDVLFSSSENSADVDWWTPIDADPTGPWTKVTIIPMLERTHTLQAADMDRDGDIDVVLGQMHTSAAAAIMVLYNMDGKATTWRQQVIDDSGLHNGVVVDLDSDGDYDIYGANWTGNPPVKLWRNRLDSRTVPTLPLNRWHYIQVENDHAQTFGLTFGDVNVDGSKDILSGNYWYQNPGGDMTGTWTQSALLRGMQAILTVDVDGDDLLDVVAQKDEGDITLYWLEPTTPAAMTWTSTQIGAVPAASHAMGAQGYRTATLAPDNRPTILISSGDGIYGFTIPDDPAAGSWPRLHISANPSDEGLAVGDIDGDGRLDIAATTGDTKRVEWYQNPGDSNDVWPTHHIGTFANARYPDRIELADLNGDHKLDIVVTEENGAASNAKSYWWAQPTDPTSKNWSAQLVTTQGSTNSLDIADMDQDGDSDLILAEHRGEHKLSIWVNVGDGNFIEQELDRGHESHLGARTVDLDGDGDLEIVSIAWDAFNQIHLWRNDAVTGSQPTPTPTPSVTPTATPLSTSPSQRVSEGLQLLYDFTDGVGDLIRDQSGVEPALDLVIADSTAVRWLDGGGLAVVQPTLISTQAAPSKILTACLANNAVTVEAWIKPANHNLNGPARIVTISADPFLRNFTLGQEYDRFEMRLRTTATSTGGIPAVQSDAVATLEPMHVIYTRAANHQARLYVDGQVVASEGIGGDFSDWDREQQLALANELTNDRPWLGEYYLVAVYCKALTAVEVTQNFRSGLQQVNNVRYLPVIQD